MAIRATRKEINETFRKVFSVPYCDIQYLTMDIAPIAYTCGVYGWNADVFAFGTTAIVTGYRPFGKEVDREYVNRFEKMAKELCNSGRSSEIAALRNEFLKAL